MWHRLGFMDHQSALSSVVSTLLALYHRDQTGEGQFVAGSLLGAGVMTNSETYLDRRRRARAGRRARPRADRHRARVPDRAGRRRMGRDRGAERRRSSRRCAPSPASTTRRARLTRSRHVGATSSSPHSSPPASLPSACVENQRDAFFDSAREPGRRARGPLPAPGLRDRSSSPARSGRSAISTYASIARRPPSASTASRSSRKSASTAPRSTAWSPKASSSAVPTRASERVARRSERCERHPGSEERACQAGNGARPRRARTSGRRSGGMVFGGWRRAGRRSSSSAVSSATSDGDGAHVGFGRPGRLRHAGDLPDELPGGGFDLLTRGGRLEAAEFRDVSAHAPRLATTPRDQVGGELLHAPRRRRTPSRPRTGCSAWRARARPRRRRPR